MGTKTTTLNFPIATTICNVFCRFCFISFAAFPSSSSPTSFLPPSVFRASEVNHFPDDKSKKKRKKRKIIACGYETSAKDLGIRRSYVDNFFSFFQDAKEKTVAYRISSLLQREERKYFVHFRGNKKGFFLIVGLIQLEPGKGGGKFSRPFFAKYGKLASLQKLQDFPKTLDCTTCMTARGEKYFLKNVERMLKFPF